MKRINYQLMTEIVHESTVPVERVDEQGNPVYEEVPVLDEYGQPLFDENGYPIMESKVVIDYETKRDIEQVFNDVEIQCTEDTFESNYAMAVAEAYNGEVQVEDVPMTAEEARTLRDKLLAETDWTQVLDAPISAESREAFRVYRQALRDITEQPEFPKVIEWPVKPEVVKAAPDPVDTALDVLIGEEEV